MSGEAGREDGGPAFPYGNPTHGGDVGMSLRDYFAGQALMGRLIDGPGWDSWSQVAREAYACADAMVAARSTPTQPPAARGTE